MLMKKLTVLLIITLIILSLFIGSSSVSANKCLGADQLKPETSSVYCWLKIKQKDSLKSVQKNFENINQTVWQKPEDLPTNIALQALTKFSSAELQKWGLNENETYYKGVTWMNQEFANKAKDAQENHQGIFQYSSYTWITPVSKTKSFCQKSKGSLSNSQLPPTVIKRLRLSQYLGLPIKPPAPNPTHFITIIAKKSDIFRPCLETAINDNQCEVFPKSAKEKEEIEAKIENQYKGLIDHRFPWTALGYTYDWGNPNNNVGASEYVIKKDAKVYIDSVYTTCDFCGCQ